MQKLPLAIVPSGRGPPDFRQEYTNNGVLDSQKKLGFPPVIVSLPQLLYGVPVFPTNIVICKT